ncbi:MAG: hypothetical protein NC102_03590 [Clostridium sp.]|nr:hypothetical protein [Clostridium sp.]
MNHLKVFLVASAAMACGIASAFAANERADSLELLAYASRDGGGGMHLAYRANPSEQWQQIGGGMSFVNSDFGPWGSHKTMFMPKLVHNADGTWTATWIADKEGRVAATVNSPDLLYWHAQNYADRKADENPSTTYYIDGKMVDGSVVMVAASEVERLKAYAAMRAEKAAREGELMKDDAQRFAGLQNLTYRVKATNKSKPISDKLMGIFFEDINYSADGGLYAELIQNRDFEYTPSDHNGWNSLTGWTIANNAGGTYAISTENPIHPNNSHYISIDAKSPGYSLSNGGFDGIAMKAGKCDFSMFAMGNASVDVQLLNAGGKVVASAPLRINSNNWKQYSLELDVPADVANGSLKIRFNKPGKASLDFISLFPQDTFKGRKNGLRKDLAQTLADLKPQFVRFPGGCVAHGNGIDNIYDWKGSIGPLHERKPLSNLWGYHQSRGIGYYEYFQFCEDIGAAPLPVLAAGVPCQNSGHAWHGTHSPVTRYGQQCGIPMEDMPAYTQDILDLIEYANGPADSEWGSKRAAAGHPEPFNLKYLGIGNEDMITPVFEERFKYIYDAVKKAHPEIEVVGTVGPFYEGTDYEEGWRLARELDIPYVDEHYYVNPAWLIYNQDYYDNYDRKGTKVYLGEWASHVPGRKSNMETALTEALYLTSVERNADVVAMTSYAPLLAKEGHTQWRPDLIYFNNTEVMPTTDYYVQQLYGQNAGTRYVNAETKLDTDNEKAAARVGSSIVYDQATGDYVIKLANLLPVAVDAKLDLKALKGAGKNATVTVLSGNPEDSAQKPVVTDTMVKALQNQTLPPYSFTVIRIHK